MGIDKNPPQSLHEHVSCELLITNKCNLNCSYCIAKKLPKSTMSIEDGRKAIDLFLFLSEGCKSIEFTFSGGEPLCEFEILKELLIYINTRCNELGVFSNYLLKTNGTICNSRILEIINKYEVNVAISIDGDQKAHDTCRKFKNGDGSYELICKNIISFLNNKNTCSGSLTVHPNFTQNLKEKVKFLFTLGLTNIDIAPVYGTVEWSDDKISDFLESLHDVAHYIKTQREHGNEIRITPLEKDSNHVGGTLDDEWGCHSGVSNLAFLPNGLITGCSALAMISNSHPEIIIGDIHNGLNQTLINDLKSLSLAGIESREKCKECHTSSDCAGGCLAINLATTGESFLPPLIYCKTIAAITKDWPIAWKNYTVTKDNQNKSQD
jgi:uncharacterized protein